MQPVIYVSILKSRNIDLNLFLSYIIKSFSHLHMSTKDCSKLDLYLFPVLGLEQILNII